MLIHQSWVETTSARYHFPRSCLLQQVKTVLLVLVYRPTAEVHNFSSTNPRELSFCKWLTKLCLWRSEHCTHDESIDPYPPSPIPQICSWATVELSWFSEYLVMLGLVSTEILRSTCLLSVISRLQQAAAAAALKFKFDSNSNSKDSNSNHLKSEI